VGSCPRDSPGSGCWQGWEAGRSLLHPTETPLPLGRCRGPAPPDRSQAGVEKRRMHRTSSAPPRLAPQAPRADLQPQPAGWCGAEHQDHVRRHPRSSAPPAVCVYWNPPAPRCAAPSEELPDTAGSPQPSGRRPRRGRAGRPPHGQHVLTATQLPTWRAESCSSSPLDLPFLPSHTRVPPGKLPSARLAGPQPHQHPAQPPQLSTHWWEREAPEPERGRAREKPCTPPPLLATSRRDRLELN